MLDEQQLAESPHTVLVCGDRKWACIRCVRDFVQQLHPDSVVVHGNCDGADRIAAVHALEAELVVYAFPAQWSRYGKVDGPFRNVRMLSETKPHLVVAFHNDLDASRGTKHMVTTASKLVIPVWVHTCPHRKESRHDDSHRSPTE